MNRREFGDLLKTSDGILLIDLESQRILDANKKLEELTGLSKDNIINNELTTLFPDSEKVKIQKLVQDFLSNNNSYLINVFIYNQIKKKDIPVIISGSIIELNNKKFLVIVIRDSIDELEKNHQFERISKLYRILYRINETIIKITDIDTLFEEVLEIILGEGGYQFAFIGELIDDNIKILKKKGNRKNIDVESTIKSLKKSIKSGEIVEFDKHIGVSVPIIFTNYLSSIFKIENKI